MDSPKRTISPNDGTTDSTEVLVAKALSALRVSKRPTISYLQRALGIGYNKSAILMDELEERGYVGPQPQSGSREIFFENFPPEEIPIEPNVPAAPSPADDTPDNDLPADTEEPHDDDTAAAEETNDRYDRWKSPRPLMDSPNRTISTEVLVAKALSALRVSKRPTISYLQRALGIGYNKSAILMDELEERGYVGPQPQSGSREIFFENFPPEEIPIEPNVPAAPSPADDTPDNDLPADTEAPHDDTDTAALPAEENLDR